MLSIFLLIPLSLMLFVVAIWAARYAVKSNQFEDLDNASQRIILDDRQERRQTIQAHDPNYTPQQTSKPAPQDATRNETDIDISTGVQSNASSGSDCVCPDKNSAKGEKFTDK